MTIREYISSVLGEYTPILSENGIPYNSINAMDWEYIITAVILVVTIYCFWKLLGSVISKII